MEKSKELQHITGKGKITVDAPKGAKYISED